MSPIEVETGPMFSGKTNELCKHANKLVIAGDVQGEDFLIYNHFSDTRYGRNVIGSHDGIQFEAIAAKSSREIFDAIFDLDEQNNVTLKEGREKLASLFIDEGQFFENNLGEILQFTDLYFQKVLGQNIDIRVAGLDMDFTLKPFNTMADVMARAGKVNKFVAVCKECKKGTKREAPYSQRIKDGKPADRNDPTVLVAADKDYTALCSEHYKLPEIPVPKFEKKLK